MSPNRHSNKKNNIYSVNLQKIKSGLQEEKKR